MSGTRLALLLLLTWTLGAAYGWYKRERQRANRSLVAILRAAQERLRRFSLPSRSIDSPTYGLLVSFGLAVLSGSEEAVVLVVLGWLILLPVLSGWVET